MKLKRTTSAVCIAALAGFAAASFAAEKKASLGQREFDNNCAVCHGAAGKGNGPLAGLIDTRVPDLTTLSAKNSGVFPVSRMFAAIDGSQGAKAHGTRDMPVWGQRYKEQAAEHYFDMPYDERQFVRARILALIEYISTLQAK